MSKCPYICIYIHENICTYFFFCWFCGCIVPGDSVGNDATSQRGTGEHPPCHGMHEEAEDEAEEVLAGLPPARKRALQRRDVEAVHEEDGVAEQEGGEESATNLSRQATVRGTLVPHLALNTPQVLKLMPRGHVYIIYMCVCIYIYTCIYKRTSWPRGQFVFVFCPN